MDDRFAGIREFVATIDQGSFSAAAVVLGVTGSAVGKSISRLEKRLGVQLLHRTTRRIDLTSEGEAYLISCRRVLEELEQAENYLSTGSQQPIGRLYIDLPSTFGRRHILPLFLELGERYPRLDLSISFRDRPVDLLSEGVDLAVRIGDLPDSSELVARRLGEQRLILCASPEYLKRRGVPTKRSDLSAHDCLTGWRRGLRSTWMLRNAQGELEGQEVNSRHELTDGDALLATCLAGGGLAQLPTWLANDALRSGALKQVLSDITGATMPIHVIWQKKWHLQPKIRIAVDELLQLADKEVDVFNPVDI